MKRLLQLCIVVGILTLVTARSVPWKFPRSNSRRDASNANVSPADDILWEKAKCKGGNLLTQMKSSDAEAGQLFQPPVQSAASQFTEFPKEFDKWGYSHSDLEDPFECDMTFLGIRRALEALGVSSRSVEEGGPFRCYTVQHSADATVDGKVYKATKGEMNIALNSADGVIIALRITSPGNMAAKAKPSITDLPALKRSSDILWGQWALHAKDRSNNIRFLISNAVTNADTNSIIQRAIEAANASTLKKWPGISFSPTSDEGKALLGSPNGLGLGYLLVQRKRELGSKCVSRIDVFAPDEGANPTILLHVEG